jgi:DNA recombination protein RmuC
VIVAIVAAVLAGAALLAALATLLAVRLQAGDLQRLRLLAEQALAGQRFEGEATRGQLGRVETGLVEALGRNVAEITAALGTLRTALAQGTGDLTTRLADEQGRLRQALAEGQERAGVLIEAKLKEMREGNEGKLAEIQRTVNEQLHAAVEKQMNESFNRVIDQFAAVQKAMGDVQAVTAHIGDIKRLFSNVKDRGGWGEAQVQAMLDDVLPPGGYETNCRMREDSREAVEFAIVMPMRGQAKTYLPIDAKFPGACSPPPRSAMSRPNAPPGGRSSAACATRRKRFRPNTSTPRPRPSSASCTCRPKACMPRWRASPA